MLNINEMRIAEVISEELIGPIESLAYALSEPPHDYFSGQIGSTLETFVFAIRRSHQGQPTEISGPATELANALGEAIAIAVARVMG